MSNLNGGLSGSGLLRGALGGGGVAPQDVYWDDILDKPDFATVATSGSYNDLTDTPTIPAAQVNADWNATSGVAEILNKPNLATVATSGSYNDLTDTPTIPAAQVNADWNATSGVAEILNKPTIPAAQVNADWNATSGVAEILNKPTIPAAQVNADWNATSGAAEIFNKPTIPTTAVQINYDNTTSGLTATDTQEAIDENAAEITTIKSNLTVNTLYNSNNIILKQMSRLHILTFDGVSASDLSTAQSTLLSYMPTDQVIRNTLYTSISGVLYFAVCLFRASDSTVSVNVVGTYGNTAANFFNTQHLLYGSLVWFK